MYQKSFLLSILVISLISFSVAFSSDKGDIPVGPVTVKPTERNKMEEKLNPAFAAFKVVSLTFRERAKNAKIEMQQDYERLKHLLSGKYQQQLNTWKEFSLEKWVETKYTPLKTIINDYFERWSQNSKQKR